MQGGQEGAFARAAQAEAWQSLKRPLHEGNGLLSEAGWAGCVEQAHQKFFQESVINFG